MSLQIKPVRKPNANMQSALQEIQKEKIAKLTINIPQSWKSEFKIAAEKKGVNMTDIILAYVKQYVSK